MLVLAGCRIVTWTCHQVKRPWFFCSLLCRSSCHRHQLHQGLWIRVLVETLRLLAGAHKSVDVCWKVECCLWGKGNGCQVICNVINYCFVAPWQICWFFLCALQSVQLAEYQNFIIIVPTTVASIWLCWRDLTQQFHCACQVAKWPTDVDGRQLHSHNKMSQ